MNSASACKKKWNSFLAIHFYAFIMNTPPGGLSKTPDVDLQEKSDRYIVTVNAPGADESSLDVKLEDRILHISIKTEHAEDQTDEKMDNINVANVLWVNFIGY